MVCIDLETGRTTVYGGIGERFTALWAARTEDGRWAYLCGDSVELHPAGMESMDRILVVAETIEELGSYLGCHCGQLIADYAPEQGLHLDY